MSQQGKTPPPAAVLRGRTTGGVGSGPSPWQTAPGAPADWAASRRNMLAASDDGMAMPSALDEFLFDLRGYSVLPQALSTAEVKEINDYVDALDLESRPIGDWEGDVELHSYYRKPGDVDDGEAPTIGGSQYAGAEKGINDGWNLQHIYEGGEPFEELLDHPAWYGHVAKYLGRASPFVFELFINTRNRGGFIGVHSGGWKAGIDGQPNPGHIVPRPGELAPAPAGAEAAGDPEWACTLVSVILALNDIGPGDGATVLYVPTQSPPRLFRARVLRDEFTASREVIKQTLSIQVTGT